MNSRQANWYLVLDAYALSKFPRLLAYGGTNSPTTNSPTLVVTEQSLNRVEAMAGGFPFYTELLALLRFARDNHVLNIEGSSDAIDVEINRSERLEDFKISTAQIEELKSLEAVADDLLSTNTSATVTFAVEDNYLYKRLPRGQYQRKRPSVLEKELTRTAQPNTDLLIQAERFIQARRNAILGEMLLGLLLVVVGFLILLAYNNGLSPLIALVFVVGLGGQLLYEIRQKFRLAYGVAEIGAGIAGAAYFLFAGASATTPGTLAVLTGLYVVVRGLDNVYKSIKGTWKEATWYGAVVCKQPLMNFPKTLVKLVRGARRQP